MSKSDYTKYLEERVEQLQSKNKALREYVRHKDNCAYIQGLKGNSIEDCDCGLEALKGGEYE